MISAPAGKFPNRLIFLPVTPEHGDEFARSKSRGTISGIP
jgi:hypothetical protein